MMGHTKPVEIMVPSVTNRRFRLTGAKWICRCWRPTKSCCLEKTQVRFLERAELEFQTYDEGA